MQTVVFGEFVWRLNAIDRPLILDCGKLRATAISSDGQLAITAADDDEYVHVWNLANGRVVRKLHVGDKEIHDLCISPDGKMLAVGTHSHEMQLWDVTAGELVLESWADSHVLCVSLTPDARFAVFGTREGRIWVVNVARARLLRILCPSEFSYVCAVAVTPDGGIVCAEDGDGTLLVWSIESGEVIRRISSSCRSRTMALAANGGFTNCGRSSA